MGVLGVKSACQYTAGGGGATAATATAACDEGELKPLLPPGFEA
jgi:hypothetical protein